jgi:TonB family protein
MNFLNYIIEVNLGIIICYALYEALLARETNFELQRGYLLIGMAVSLLFPLLNFNSPVSRSTEFASSTLMLPEFVVKPGQSLAALGSAPGWTLAGTLWLIYFAGILLLLAPVLFQAIRLYFISRRSGGRYEGDCYVIESNKSAATYSFFKLIVVGMADRLSSEEKKLVILHEQYHSRMLHTLDVLVATLLCAAFWFNPVTWLYRKRLINVHEFQADRFVSNMSSPADYTLLLAKSAMIGSGLQLTHNLSQSFILKRINMINQLQKKVGGWKLLTAASVVVSFAVVVSCTDQVSESTASADPSKQPVPSMITEKLASLKDLNPSGQYSAIPLASGDLESLKTNATQSIEYFATTKDHGTWAIVNSNRTTAEVFTMVEHSAMPADGMTSYYERLSEALTYPQSARQQGIEGRVFVEFIVQTDGRFTDLKVLKGISADCDEAALAAIAQVQGWTPGLMNGKPVAQRLVLPITFKLQ